MPQAGSWHSSPPFISPPLLIILLPILALTLFFAAVPPLLSAASNALRPISVKTSWDSLNILLVVLAILCGVFARRNDDEPSPQNAAVPDQNGAPEEERVGGGGYELHPPPPQWFGFSEEAKIYDATPTGSQSQAIGVTRLRTSRRSSSYPDLRQWETRDDGYQFRFFDDFEIDKQSRSPLVEHRDRWPETQEDLKIDQQSRSPLVEHREQWPETHEDFEIDKQSSSPLVEHRERWPETQEDKEEVRVKEIPVDTFEVRPTSPVKSPAPPPSPPPPPVVSARRNPRRAHQKVENEITEVVDSEFTRVQSPPSSLPTPPSPPRPSVKARSESKHGKGERRKSNVKREIAMVWASVLSNQRKRKKKQRTKNDESHNQHYNNADDDEVTHNTRAPPATPPPQPPPLPPPPSVFHSLFRKAQGKSKKIHSVTAPPAPPPPPPLTSSRRWSPRKSQIPPPAAPPPEPSRRRNSGRPPLPNRASNSVDEAVNAGNQSPLIPIPPPLPPFKVTAMKFTVRGGFVNVRSNQSSRCSSPEREHIDVEVSNKTTIGITPNAATAAVVDHSSDAGGSVFCASPDVNLKAATFIARLREKWRLENSNGSLPPPGRDYSL